MWGGGEFYRATFTEGTFDPCMCDPASISHRVVIMEITNRRPVIVVYRSLSLSGFPRGSERSSERSRGATDKLIARPAEREKKPGHGGGWITMRFEWVWGWASKVDTYPVPSPRIALCMRDEDRIPGSRAKIPPPLVGSPAAHATPTPERSLSFCRHHGRVVVFGRLLALSGYVY